MQLFVYTLSTTLFEGKVDRVTFPSEAGQVTILPGHEPYVMTLADGSLLALESEGDEHIFQMAGGIARVNQESVVVLAH